jgi:thioredoxin reductase (NADPH)
MMTMLRTFVLSLFLSSPVVAFVVGPSSSLSSSVTTAGRHHGAATTGIRRTITSSTPSRLQMAASEEIECDVVIIGGGPAGCTCALYTARANHRTVILDKNPSAGALAITHTIANYPGVDPTISGEALLKSMRDQAIAYGTDYRQAQVFMVDFDSSEEWKIVYTPECTVKAKTLVLATGALGRKPTYQGEADYLGKGVSYCATCDGAFYQEAPVVVVGTNPEAMEEAEHLTKFASTVHWITRSPIEASAQSHADSLLSHPNVKQWTKTRLVKVEGDASGVTNVQLKQMGKRTQEELKVEGVFIYEAGSKPVTDYLTSRIALNEEGGVIVDDAMSTNVPGVFAIGDIRNTPFKQVVVAAGDGCVAAMAIDRYLKGRKNFRVDWIHQ